MKGLVVVQEVTYMHTILALILCLKLLLDGNVVA